MYLHTFIHTSTTSACARIICIFIYIFMYIYTYIHIYIHTYIQTSTQDTADVSGKKNEIILMTSAAAVVRCDMGWQRVVGSFLERSPILVGSFTKDT